MRRCDFVKILVPAAGTPAGLAAPARPIEDQLLHGDAVILASMDRLMDRVRFVNADDDEPGFVRWNGITIRVSPTMGPTPDRHSPGALPC